MTVIVTDTGFAAEDWNAPFATLADLAAHKGAVDMSNTDDPEALRPHLAELGLIRVAFPAFNDGRAFTIARRLRMMGYTGRLRAQGHVIADQYAMARRCGLSIAVQHIDADAQSGGLIDQFLTVFRFTRCGGGDHAHAVDLHRAGQRFKAGQGGQRLFHRRFVNLAIACEARTQFYPAFFIVNGQGRARRACIYHEPDSVGANINDGLTHRLHLCRTRLKVGTFLSSASAPPRPESDALVMK
jgi:uncharacterized protein (DUF934 family)